MALAGFVVHDPGRHRHEALIGDDLAKGRLVRPFGPDVPSPYNYYLVCPPAAAELPKVQAFARWIRGLAEATQKAAA